MQEPDARARLKLQATISPSEDPARVARALANVVGVGQEKVAVAGSGAELVTEAPGALARIRDQLRDRHVRAAARKQMLLNVEGTSTSVMLNRQAAAAGIVALCGSPEESPLGPIYMRIESDRLEATIDWLTAYPG